MGYRVWSRLTNRDEDEVIGDYRNWDIFPIELGRPFVRGHRIADQWPKVIYDVESEYPPVDTFPISTRLVVSKRMAQIIAEYVPSTDVEYLPISITYKGQLYGEYYILHPLVIIDAIDRSRSKYELFKGKVDAVKRLALDEDKLQGKHLVDLGSCTWLICVSDKLATAIEQSSMHGVVFPTPEKWRPY